MDVPKVEQMGRGRLKRCCLSKICFNTQEDDGHTWQKSKLELKENYEKRLAHIFSLLPYRKVKKTCRCGPCSRID